MDIELTAKAEEWAVGAEDLPAFTGIKLLNIKKNLAHLLELIGREQIFHEYTRHDISHIDRMLEMLDWVVPDATRRIMTQADWLVTVLSIYFHDLGMLVTRKEYEARNSSGFPEFRENVLFAGDKAADYKAKVKQMGQDVGDRFLYQEFVRHTHAERIRAWLTGQAREKLGISTDVVNIINELLAGVDEGFREDLALVCESHHLDDLRDFKKYKVRRPYGNREQETANLQYAAVLMRTTDLLHITKDRTPSTLFRLINPTDPLSQEEWSKQMAVTTVRSQLGRDREGNLDDQAPRDTIEVHARFTNEEGFFALTSYLIYANEQIRKSYDAVKLANRTQGVHHEFPWRKIDDTDIETKGFIRETFGFTIDQPRILKLLTGHTLYNDTNVVLRELVQNALDAVRLQRLIDSSPSPSTTPSIEISYDSKNRLLTVKDHGTGMSQEVIERNLLTVGASRYEDPEFKKLYPGFSAISRFGIGILSTFMIADVVEIITCSLEEEHARQLSLRSVLGRYLIRLLDKEKDQEAKQLAPHGTLIKLKIRQSAESPDVVGIAKRWIVVPECEVTIQVDDSEPLRIGWMSPKEALEQSLLSAGITLETDNSERALRKICVREAELNGVTVAYGLKWSEYLQEWSFLQATEVGVDPQTSIGTCVEGVRVEFNSPGFDDIRILALANAKGPNAPKTNVARSGLEATSERDEKLSSIYSIYCRHVKSEIEALDTERSYSLTWAVQESKYILNSLLRAGRYSTEEVPPTRRKLLFAEIEKLPIILVEHEGAREAMSPQFLQDQPLFWTAYSPSFSSAESLIRETPVALSLSALAKFFSMDLALPDGLLLCGVRPSDALEALALSAKEVDQIIINRKNRVINLRWSAEAEPKRWRTFPTTVKLPVEVKDFADALERYSSAYNLSKKIHGSHFARTHVNVTGLDQEDGVNVHGQLYFLFESQSATLINNLFDLYDRERTRETLIALGVAIIVSTIAAMYSVGSSVAVSRMMNVIRDVEPAKTLLDAVQLQTILTSGIELYDPWAWSRNMDSF